MVFDREALLFSFGFEMRSLASAIVEVVVLDRLF